MEELSEMLKVPKRYWFYSLLLTAGMYGLMQLFITICLLGR
ncbi:hypothetical protein ACLIA0_06150 [Bacillaceae bacterium W0354]